MKKILLILVSLAFSYDVSAQRDSILITGFIRDSLNKEAIPFVDILLDMNYDQSLKPKYKTQTDIDGFFKMKISTSDFSNNYHVLFFRFVGYEIKPLVINTAAVKETLSIYGRPVTRILGHDDPTEYMPLKNK